MKFLQSVCQILVFCGLFAGTDACAADYAVGQVWAYKTRPGEEKSRLVIVKIDPMANKEFAYSIFIENVAIKNPHIDGGIQKELPHAPVSKGVLDQSVVQLLESRKTLPDYVSAYEQWKKAFDSGHAGVFSLSVSEILSSVETVANRPIRLKD